MGKITIDIREHHADVIRETEVCALCLGSIEPNKQNRGVVEFQDGWDWICGKCRKLVGKRLDITQAEYHGDYEVIPYYKRSRKRWLKWIEKEYQINIGERE